MSLFYGCLALFASAGWGWLICTASGKHPSRDADRLLLVPFVGLGAAALLGSVLWMYIFLPGQAPGSTVRERLAYVWQRIKHHYSVLRSQSRLSRR